MMWAIVLGLVVVGVTHWVYRWRNPRCDKGTLPPGSMGLPLIGETFQFFSLSSSLEVPPFLRTRIKKYGKIFKTSVAGRAVVMSADSDFNHYILQQEGKLVELWYMDSFAELVGQGGPLKELVAAGHLHKNLKKLIMEHIGIESLKNGDLFPLMDQAVNRTLDSWTTSHNKGRVEVRAATAKMTMDLALSIMLGYDPETIDPNLSTMFSEFRKGLLSFPLKLPGTVLHSCLQNQKKILKMIMDTMTAKRGQRSPSSTTDESSTVPTRRSSSSNYDMMDRLIDDEMIQTSTNDKAISYLMFALLFANAETIPAILTLAMKLLIDHPLVMEELVKENEEILRTRESKEGGGLTWKEYKSMNFTMNVINELLRLNGSLGIIRRAIADIHVNGYVIPKGWTIAVMPTAVHMNSEPYEDPLSFNPWRWKGTNANPKNFIPFGGGMRTCVGAEYSKVLLAVFVHALVTKYRWKSIKGGQVYRAPSLQFGDGYYVELSKREAKV